MPTTPLAPALEAGDRSSAAWLQRPPGPARRGLRFACLGRPDPRPGIVAGVAAGERQTGDLPPPPQAAALLDAAADSMPDNP